MTCEGVGGVLGDYVELQRGTTYKSALLDQPGPVLLGLSSIARNGGFRADNLRTYGGESQDKLLVRSGQLYASLKDVTQSADLLGAVAKVPDTILCGRLTQDTVRLDITDTAMPSDYLYWLLRTPQYRAYCRAHATGTTNLGLSREDFLAYEVPPLTIERRAVLRALHALDNKIESNRRLAKMLEEIVFALFKARFVDFNGDDDLVESPIGPIPRGWSAAALNELSGVYRELLKDVADLPYVGLDAMPRDSTILAEWKTAGAPRGQSVMFAEGDILFGKLRPYFRKVGVALIDGRCSTEILVLRPNDPSYFGFLLGHVSSQQFIDHCVAISRGTRMPRAEWKDAGTYEVAVPPKDVAADFTALTRKVYGFIRVLVHESRTLTTIRDLLLPRLISGQISTPTGKQLGSDVA